MKITKIERKAPEHFVYWVHVHATGEDWTEAALSRRARAEARKWAAELGMECAGPVSSGGTYGRERVEHRMGYIFKEVI